jgi:hypothetical protein
LALTRYLRLAGGPAAAAGRLNSLDVRPAENV